MVVAYAAAAVVGLAAGAWVSWVCLSLFGDAARWYGKARHEKGMPAGLALAEALMLLLCVRWHRLPRPTGAKFPAGRPFLLVAPHRCSLDPFLIHSAADCRIDFLVAKEYADLPLVGSFLRMVGCIPVDRSKSDPASLKAALRRLKDGAVVGIFPEGGIADPGDTSRTRAGVGMIALRAGVPVIPVTLHGVRPSHSVVGGFFFRGRPRVEFGAPVDLSEFAGRRPTHRDYEAAAAKILAAVGIAPPPPPAPHHHPPATGHPPGLANSTSV